MSVRYLRGIVCRELNILFDELINETNLDEEIKNLIIKKKNKAGDNQKFQPGSSSQIYFFGG